MRRNAFVKRAKRSEKCIREKKEDRKTRNIEKILEELKGTKNISNVKSAKERILNPKIKNMEGETITTRKGIANVFAEFYATLYEDDKGEDDKEKNEAKTHTENKEKMPMQSEPIPEFTTSEIQDAVDRLKRRKAGESGGVRAQQLKN